MPALHQVYNVKTPMKRLLFYLVSKKSTSKENSIGSLNVSALCACADEEDTHEEMSLLRFRKSAHGICNPNPPSLCTYSLLFFFFFPPWITAGKRSWLQRSLVITFTTIHPLPVSTLSQYLHQDIETVHRNQWPTIIYAPYPPTTIRL